MTAGACAMFVIVGGSVAGAVSTMTNPGPGDIAVQPVDIDLGAPRLEEDPEVVSRAAAAAQPLPRRQGETTPPPRPPAAAATTAGESTASRTTGRRASAPHVATAADQLSQARVADDRADRTGPRRVRTLAEPPARRQAAAPPVVTTRTDVETRAVPFDTQVVRDPSMLRGTRRVTTRGVAGERTLRYLVTLTDGKPSSRRLLSSEVTREPQKRVVAVGSARHEEPDLDCDSILGICLPFGRAAVVCPADGGGDRAVPEPVRVTGEDPGEILIAEEDLELIGPGGLDAMGPDPAVLC